MSYKVERIKPAKTSKAGQGAAFSCYINGVRAFVVGYETAADIEKACLNETIAMGKLLDEKAGTPMTYADGSPVLQRDGTQAINKASQLWTSPAPVVDEAAMERAMAKSINRMAVEPTYDAAVELRKKLMAKLGVTVASAEEVNI